MAAAGKRSLIGGSVWSLQLPPGHVKVRIYKRKSMPLEKFDHKKKKKRKKVNAM